MSANTAYTSRRSAHPNTLRGISFAVVVTVGGGLVLGGLTSPGQQYLPSWLYWLSNSVGGWSMLTFLLVWLSRARPVLGAILGAAAFNALLEGYGLVSAWRGFYYAAPFSTMWVIPGILAGLVLGLGAALTRYTRRPLRRWLAVVPLAVVLIADSLRGIATDSPGSSPVYWYLQLTAAVGFIVAAVIRRRRA